ncbi:2OG-Fe(II) oxygenase [Methylocystis sp. H62]|uniref:2OG-Fe(II) oxygenase n=1 Tax=Methylocystis sp. H62 TaxID=2785789 RepID=UPI0018C315E7|nr:2OG-Fe(II) oxygenase [Methylocystis sp. H62]MBG0794478.1 2OG-Fe(II) oxygenase [Methylocystis sp. H62]
MLRENEHFFDAGNRVTRIDVFEELNAQILAALRQFARRLGAPHLIDEFLLPTLAEGDARIVAAVRDRPWPPWGLGSREIVAICVTHSIADGSYAVSPVYTLPQELTNIGLISAVYKEALDQLSAHPRAEICYLAAEHSTLADHVLTQSGFGKTEDVFVTPHARYHTYRAAVDKVQEALGIANTPTPDLLAHAIDSRALAAQSYFHQTIYMGSLAEWLGTEGLASEIIRLVRGGHAGKPGGVPSGTGRWEVDPISEVEFVVSFANMLGPARDQLMQYALASESRFTPAMVVRDASDCASVDEVVRRARTLDDLGPFKDVFAKALTQHLEPALKKLKLPGFPVGQIEMQITASGNGDFYRLHSDTGSKSTREVSFAYHFFREPRRFSGGELRIYGKKMVAGQLLPADHFQTLSPRQDTLFFFASANDHEVLPVRVPSGEFGDSRFTVNGWIHRRD